jgi:prepilin-type N-terminal cleavage/methylation domain-containing protein
VPTHSQNGFSLIEALIATVLIAVAVVSLVHLIAAAATQSTRTWQAGTALAAAQAKLEQLRSLSWTYAPDGMRTSDLSADTTAEPPRASGGTGLSLSPAGALFADRVGYVDRLDRGGRAAADFEFSRRWAVSLLDASDPDTLLLQVCVFRRGPASTAPDVCVWSVRTRTQ